MILRSLLIVATPYVFIFHLVTFSFFRVLSLTFCQIMCISQKKKIVLYVDTSHLCGTTYSYVWHGAFLCVTWLIHTSYFCVLQCVAVCCSVLQCIAVCCRVLPWVVVCCSVLQPTARNVAGMSHVPHMQVSLIWRRHAPHMKESCLSYKGVTNSNNEKTPLTTPIFSSWHQPPILCDHINESRTLRMDPHDNLSTPNSVRAFEWVIFMSE